MMWSYMGMQSRLENMSLRVSAMETEARERNLVDPLIPPECAESGRMGRTQASYCQTTIYRLLQAPQQFNGRWIMVEGLYARGGEASALHASRDDEPPSAMSFAKHLAIWISPGFETEANTLPNKVVIGKFRWGPAGHMGEYFGELTDAVSLR